MSRKRTVSKDTPLIIYNPGDKDGESFVLDSLYMLTLELFDFRTQTLTHTMISPGFYLPRKGVLSEEYRPDIRPLHRHQSLELMFVLKGEVTQYIEDFERVYRAGECCILNKNILHTEAYSSDFEAVFLLMADQFLLKAIEGDCYFSSFHHPHAANYAVFEKLHRLLEETSAFEKEYLDFFPLREAHEVCEEVQKIFAALLLETRQQKPGFLHIVYGQLVRLLALLSDSASYQMNCVDLKRSREDYIFNRVMLYLRKHHGRVNYDELEGLMNYTRDYLNRVVKRRLGMSLVSLGQSFCLEEAADLLLKTDKSVSQIVQQLGYTNRTYFYRIFQEKYGMTPKEYRARGIAAPLLGVEKKA